MIIKPFIHLPIILILLTVCKTEKTGNPARCFRNPLIGNGADPWIIKLDSVYHYCYSAKKAIFIKSSSDIVKIKENVPVKIWKGVPGTDYSSNIWAPELHYYQNKWYIYFAADNGNNETHRMYVLESDSEDINSTFNFIGKLETEKDRWAIDGTILPLGNRLFFIWSGWEGSTNVSQGIYITEMSSPTEIMRNSRRILISEPEFSWEKKGTPLVNEGPQILISKNGKVFIIYSGSGSWTDFYCLGMLRLDGDDPMSESAWYKYPEPVFKGTKKVISPGHCSFTKIGKEDWIIYHAAKFKGAGWDRYIKMQKFKWRNDEPYFGDPVPDGKCIKLKY